MVELESNRLNSNSLFKTKAYSIIPLFLTKLNAGDDHELTAKILVYQLSFSLLLFYSIFSNLKSFCAAYTYQKTKDS
jgi:hypothetical protein